MHPVVVPLPFFAVGVDYVREFPVARYGVDYIRGSQVTKCCLKASNYLKAFIRGTANLFKLVFFLLVFSRRINKQAKKTWDPLTTD